MLDKRLRSRVSQGLAPIGKGLERAGISANLLTVIGLAFSVVTALLIGAGELRWAVLGLIASGFVDLLDGAVARRSGQASPRGAFFDSVTDRVSDAVVLGGVAWYLAGESPYLSMLAFAAAALSMLVSYERARAEGLGYDAKGGLMERAERMVLLGFGLFFNVLVPVLWLMIVLTSLTAVQRFVKVWRQASDLPARPVSSRPGIAARAARRVARKTASRCWPVGGSSAVPTRAVKRVARRAPPVAAGPDRREPRPAASDGHPSRVVSRVPRGRGPGERASRTCRDARRGIGGPRRSRRCSAAGGGSWPATSAGRPQGGSRGWRCNARCRTPSRRTAGTGSSCSGSPRTREVSVEPRFDAEGWEHIETALAAGNGLILALPHLGGFDFAAAWLAGRGSRRRSSSNRSSRPSSSRGSPASVRPSGWKWCRSARTPAPQCCAR